MTLPDPAKGARGGASIDEVLDQHRTVRRLVDELRCSSDLRQVMSALDGLRAFLADHFRVEAEPQGFYDTILQSAPWFEGRANRLVADHAAIEAEIEAVREQARALLEGPVSQVFARVDALGRRIGDHEADENQLLSDALYEEVGGSE